MSQQYLNQLFSYGVQALQNSDLTLAQKTFHQILKDFPKHPDALNLLGVVFGKKGSQEKALSYFTQAIEQNPTNANYYLNRGLAYSKGNELDQATTDLQKAIALNPQFPDAFFNLGNVEKAKGNLESARRNFEKVLNIQPEHGQALYNLGNLNLEIGHYKTAIGFFERAVKVNPNFAMAHNNLGTALQEWDRWDEAEEHFKIASSIDPQATEASRNLAQLYERQGRTEEAKNQAQLLNKIKKDPWQIFHAEIMCPIIPQSNKEIDQYRARLNEVLDHYLKEPPLGDPDLIYKSGVEPPSNLIYQGRNDKLLKRKFAELFSRYFPPQPALNKSNNKIKRIGFVVTGGHEGVFIKCMRGIINHLSSEKFIVTLICSLPNGEKILGPAIGSDQINYLSLPNDLTSAANLIRNAAFDVLHYWEVGTDSLNYFLPFYRLAPVQCTSWGWPVTSGIPNMDYFVSAEGLEIEGAENHYTEKLVRLKRLPLYYYPPPVPTQLATRSTYGLPDDAHLYLCNQNLRKVHPDFDSVIAEILNKDKKGLALFIEDKQKNITHLFKNRFTATHPEIANQLRIVKRMPEQEYLGLVGCADVVLDTPYYTGGANTTYDAFAMGTPIVTFPSEFHSGRYTLASYQQIGIVDCIANSRENYIEKALRLGTDRTVSQTTGRKIKDTAHSLFKDQAAINELAFFFENC